MSNLTLEFTNSVLICPACRYPLAVDNHGALRKAKANYEYKYYHCIFCEFNVIIRRKKK